MLSDEKIASAAEVGHITLTPPSQHERPTLKLQGPSSENLSAQDLMFSASQCPTPAEEYDPTSTHPFSPFYSHPTTRTSFEQLKSSSKLNLTVYQHDLEAASLSRTSTEGPMSTIEKDRSVLPGRKRYPCAKGSLCTRTSTNWNPCRDMNKKQKLWAKVVIALIILGTAVGLGVGISKAVGGGVWKNVNSEGSIGDSH